MNGRYYNYYQQPKSKKRSRNIGEDQVESNRFSSKRAAPESHWETKIQLPRPVQPESKPTPMLLDHEIKPLFSPSPFLNNTSIRLPDPKLVNSKPVVFYPLQDAKAMTAFAQSLHSQGISYQQDTDPPPVQIAPVAALGKGALGIYAMQPLVKTNLALGHYVGELLKADTSIPGAYIFEISRDGQLVDAAHKRNWTAYINHAENANVLPLTYDKKGKEESVAFYTRTTINEGNQLLFNYGQHFFSNISPPIKPLYLHPTDNWETPEERYKANSTQYCDYIQEMDPATARALDFMPSRLVAATCLFRAVFNKDKRRIERALRQEKNVDRLSYNVAKSPDSLSYALQAANEQAHITPLMLACYFNQEKVAKLLLDKGADVNRRALRTGNTPLFFVLQGPEGSEAAKLPLIELLMSHGADLLVENIQKHTLLYYCIEKNYPIIADKLLSRISQNSVKYLLDHIVSKREHADFQQGYLEKHLPLLEVLIKYSPSTWLQKILKEEQVFLKHLCLQTPLSHLSAVLKLLQKRAELTPKDDVMTKIAKYLTERQQTLTDTAILNEIKYTLGLLPSSLNVTLVKADNEWHKMLKQLSQQLQTLKSPQAVQLVIKSPKEETSSRLQELFAEDFLQQHLPTLPVGSITEIVFENFEFKNHLPAIIEMCAQAFPFFTKIEKLTLRSNEASNLLKQAKNALENLPRSVTRFKVVIESLPSANTSTHGPAPMEIEETTQTLDCPTFIR